MNRLRMLAVAVVCPAVLVLLGCVTEQSDPALARMRASEPAIIAVAVAGATMPADASFAWLPESINFYNDQRLQDTSIQHTIERLIRQNLRDLGYRFTDAPAQAGYSIGYTAALESSLDDNEIMRRFGLLPGNNRVPEGNPQYEKGSLVIYVLEAGSGEVIWRSAVQAAVDFSADDASREKRLNGIIKDMFLTFPKPGD